MNKRLFAVSTTNSNRGAGKPFPGAIPTEGGPEEYEVQMEVTNEPHCLEDDAEEQPVKSQRPTVTRRALGVSSAGFRAPRSPPAKKKRPVPTDAVRGPRHSPPLKDIGLGRADYSGRSVCSVEELTALEQRVKALEDNAQRHGEKLVRLYGMMDGLVEDVCGSVRRTTDELSVTVLRAVDEISDDVTYALRCIYHELREDEEE
uniref:EB1 C-terminal domain-containing protein n=1 Tax=Globodera pallida TaxID=36090 RepID=A0A183CNL8_GLOPA